MAAAKNAEKAPITIKKYANRRLYNTATRKYVALNNLTQMVKEANVFFVYDAKSGDDITRQVLTHIIVEQEGKGPNLLPISFLKHLISFYGSSLQTIVPNYLEYAMQAFAQNQEQMRGYMQDTLDGLSPFGQFEKLGNQNMAMIENAMKMFAPFYPESSDTTGKRSRIAKTDGDDGKGLEDLRSKLANMQKQLEKLSRSKDEP